MLKDSFRTANILYSLKKTFTKKNCYQQSQKDCSHVEFPVNNKSSQFQTPPALNQGTEESRFTGCILYPP